MNLGRENGDGQGGQTFVEVHSSRPLYFGGPDTALILRPAEAENSQGAWARGRARAGGRSQGPPPPRPSGCPPRPPRARRSRRPEEQEEEERSEPSPGALRDRVPGGGGGGSAPAGEFIPPLPT
ncbi:guanine nucleotide-binding protein G(I)/G(S)/G(O) subunit gamma-12 isoform X2 [Panthera onca]